MRKLLIYINIPLVLMLIIKVFFINKNELMQYVLLYISIDLIMVIPGMALCNIVFSNRKFEIFELPCLFFTASLISIFLILSLCFIFRLSINTAIMLYLAYALILFIYNVRTKRRIFINSTEIDKIGVLYIILTLIFMMIIGFYGSSLTGDPLTHISLVRRIADEGYLKPITLYPLEGKTFWAGYVYNYWQATLSMICMISHNDPCFVWVNLLVFILHVFFSAQMLLANKIFNNNRYTVQLPLFIILYSILFDVYFNFPAFNLSRLLLPENLNKNILMIISSYFLIDILENKNEEFYSRANRLFFVLTLCVINIIHMNYIIYLGLIYGVFIFTILALNFKDKFMRSKCICSIVLLIVSFIPSLMLNIKYVKQDEVSIQKAMQYAIDNNMISSTNNQTIIIAQGNLLFVFAILAVGIIIFNNEQSKISKWFTVNTILIFHLINNKIIIHILLKISPIWILWRMANIIPVWIIVSYFIFVMERFIYQVASTYKKLNKELFVIVYSIFFIYIFIKLAQSDYVRMNAFRFMYINQYLSMLLYAGVLLGMVIKKFQIVNTQKSPILMLVFVMLFFAGTFSKISMEAISKRLMSSVIYSNTYGYNPSDIIDGEWDNDLLLFITKKVPNYSKIAFSNKGTGEVIICFKNISILSSANATPNEELFKRQIENERLFDKSANQEEIKGIFAKNKINYVVITPLYRDTINLYNKYKVVYEKNGYAIIKIE